MPELPDLTIFAKNLRRHLLNKEITSADVFNRAKVNATPEAFSQALTGHAITAIDRNGKELFFTLDDGQRFACHLMLNGRFSLPSQTELFSINAKIIALTFAGGSAFTVSDISHMARVSLNPPEPTVPDALSPAFTFEYFESIARKKASANIKAFLIDQQVVRGIGNAYVDEILWKANVSPKSIVGKIPPEYLYLLYEAIHSELEDAIVQIERIKPDIISGEERSFLHVHVPRKRTTDDGEPILCEEIVKKKTYYTAKQLLFI